MTDDYKHPHERYLNKPAETTRKHKGHDITVCLGDGKPNLGFADQHYPCVDGAWFLLDQVGFCTVQDAVDWAIRLIDSGNFDLRDK